MAQPSTQMNDFRSRMERLLDGLNYINDVLAPIEGGGDTDAEKAAFFAPVLVAEYDITLAELNAAVTKLRELQVWHATNLVTLAKMRP